METEDSIKQRGARVQSALQSAFGVRATSLSRALHKTGRRLPRRLHADGQTIVAAEGYGGNPRLLRTLDGVALAEAEERLVTWLETVDYEDARRGYWTGVGAMVGANILLLVGGIVFWMWWTGRI